MTQTTLLAGVELGGTKCLCVLGTGPHDIRARVRIKTGEPGGTLEQIAAVLDEWRTGYGPIAALGIASFGPLDLSPGSATYGHITASTKPGWSHTDVVGPLTPLLGVPVRIDTDVNGAALAEARWGAARGLADFAYITVGTGVGVGLVIGDRLVHGLTHTELGHVRVARPVEDRWPGVCAFHGDCVEGLASGPAIEARAGSSAADLSPEHAVWGSVAHALGQLLHTLVLATAPRRILLGGGVMDAQPHLFPRVREALRVSLNGYVQASELGPAIGHYVVPPGLGAAAGAMGALALAAAAQGAR